MIQMIHVTGIHYCLVILALIIFFLVFIFSFRNKPLIANTCSWGLIFCSCYALSLSLGKNILIDFQLFHFNKAYILDYLNHLKPLSSLLIWWVMFSVGFWGLTGKYTDESFQKYTSAAIFLLSILSILLSVFAVHILISVYLIIYSGFHSLNASLISALDIIILIGFIDLIAINIKQIKLTKMKL